MNANNSNNILDQIAEDPFVKGTWFFTVTWFVIKLIAFVCVVLYIVTGHEF